MNKTQFNDTQMQDFEEALGMEGIRYLPRKKLTALLMVGKGLV
jgi:hypothetical protein